ncbi:MAG: ATP-dependent zinc metalloprotease FtsH [Planctomycetes bacterium ADurb.Bin126]|nr:MAG: ATP-dependent zinc metalloprotease FtsH [Planctomycetes bacterium ADurb.Bin126]HOD81568.1 ATP-dependent zinc metalloprotease FtsH [Phycisphaerae bacterium]
MDNQTPEKPPTPQPPQGPSRMSRSLIGWVVIGGLLLLMMSFITNRGWEGRREISIYEFWKLVENNQLVGKIIIRERKIEGQIDPNSPLHKKDEPDGFYVTYSYRADESFMERLLTRLNQHNPPAARPYIQLEGWWESVLPQLMLVILISLLIWFLVFRRMAAGGGGAGFLGNFGRSRHRVSTPDRTKVTFNDVAGIDEAKDEVAEIIEFLRNPRKFQRLGGRIPRGVLLVGEPGCGKTLLAKAIAGEADVPFFSISGSDFVEMFVGVGASRVRDLFKQAKDRSPCIVFLDEIDAVGRRRGMGFNGGGHDEREQTLNAILVEMDGFDSSDQVIVIAATNRMDVLDPALTRPGRFDRQINVPLPDLNGRYQILKIYISKVKCGPDVDLNRLARGTPMFSGADLAALVNEAALAATMANKEFIEQDDLEEARDKVRWGRARKSRVIDEKEKKITAYHEAGHALVQVLTPEADPLHKVSIIPRGSMGGATFSLPEKDRYLYTRSYCLALLRVCLAGRVAEQIFCGDVSSGASNDIAQATEIARKMVADWGMSEKLGLMRYASEDGRIMLGEIAGKEYSDNTAQMIDEEIKALIDEAYRDAVQIMQDNRDKLEALAEALLRYETLSADEVNLIIGGQRLAKPTMDDLLSREHARGISDAPKAPDAAPKPPQKDLDQTA